MNTQNIRITSLLLLTLAACTPAGEDLEPSEDRLEDELELESELVSAEERRGAEIPSVHFEAKVDHEVQREIDKVHAESCQVDGAPRLAESLALAPPLGLVDPRFRLDEDPIQASIAAQEARDLQPEAVEAREPDDELVAAQARYLAGVEQLEAELAGNSVQLVEAKAELKHAELGG